MAKYLTEKWKERRLYSGSQFEGYSPSWQGRHSNRDLERGSEDGSCICIWEAERDKCWCSAAHFLLFIQFEFPDYRMVLPTSGWVYRPQLKLSEKSLTLTPSVTLNLAEMRENIPTIRLPSVL